MSGCLSVCLFDSLRFVNGCMCVCVCFSVCFCDSVRFVSKCVCLFECVFN